MLHVFESQYHLLGDTGNAVGTGNPE